MTLLHLLCYNFCTLSKARSWHPRALPCCCSPYPPACCSPAFPWSPCGWPCSGRSPCHERGHRTPGPDPGLSATSGHPSSQRLLPDRQPHRHRRPQRRRQVHPAQGHRRHPETRQWPGQPRGAATPSGLPAPGRRDRPQLSPQRAGNRGAGRLARPGPLARGDRRPPGGSGQGAAGGGSRRPGRPPGRRSLVWGNSSGYCSPACCCRTLPCCCWTSLSPPSMRAPPQTC